MVDGGEAAEVKHDLLRAVLERILERFAERVAGSDGQLSGQLDDVPAAAASTGDLKGAGRGCAACAGNAVGADRIDSALLRQARIGVGGRGTTPARRPDRGPQTCQ
jgi:hypothetical protein